MSSNISELYAIIQFMSPNQKRRFTMQCQLSKPNSNSLVLFNALNKLKKYDKEKLDKELRKQGRVKLADNIVTETILLYKLILKLMKFSAEEKSIERKLENDFDDIVFIQNKGFFVRSERMLKNVKKDAEKHEQSALLLRVYKYERMLKQHFDKYKDLDSIEKTHKKELELLDDIVLERKLMHIDDKVLFLYQYVTVLEENMVAKLLDEIEIALNELGRTEFESLPQRITYVSLMAKLSELKSDRKAVFKWIEEMHRIYKICEESNIFLGFQYSWFLANYLNYLIMYNEPERLILKVLTKVKSIKPNTAHEKMTKFSNIGYLEFLFYLKQGDFETLEKLIPALLKGLEKYSNDIEQGRNMVIWYNLMICYFINEDFDSAHIWVEKILDYGNGNNTRRLDTLNKGRLFKLLIHYELGSNITLLQSLMKKIKRGFKDVDDSKGLTGVISKLMNTHYRKGKLEKEDFEKALQRFYKIEKIEKMPYDEIEIWLKSKLQGLPMLQIAQLMLQSKKS